MKAFASTATFCNVGEREAWCITHNRQCLVQRVDLWIVGTVCKDMSKQNLNRQRHKGPVLKGLTSPSGSAQTFRGFLAYVSSHTPSIIVFENVDAMDDKDVGGVNNLDILLAEMSSRGYEGQRFLLDSSEFGLPARRRRVYCIFMRVVANPCLSFRHRTVDQTMCTLRLLVRSARRRAPCVSQVLLADDDSAVENELAKRLAVGARLGEEKAQWADAHIREFQAQGLRWGSRILKDDSTWLLTLLPRERDALRFGLSSDGSVLLRNISQGITRLTSSSFSEDLQVHIAPAMLPSQLLWISRPNVPGRLMIGREALLLQGFPIASVQRLVDERPERFFTRLGWEHDELIGRTDVGDECVRLSCLDIFLLGCYQFDYPRGVRRGARCFRSLNGRRRSVGQEAKTVKWRNGPLAASVITQLACKLRAGPSRRGCAQAFRHSSGCSVRRISSRTLCSHRVCN